MAIAENNALRGGLKIAEAHRAFTSSEESPPLLFGLELPLLRQIVTDSIYPCDYVPGLPAKIAPRRLSTRWRRIWK